jgi:hypothetical protein
MPRQAQLPLCFAIRQSVNNNHQSIKEVLFAYGFKGPSQI